MNDDKPKKWILEYGYSEYAEEPHFYSYRPSRRQLFADLKYFAEADGADDYEVWFRLSKVGDVGTLTFPDGKFKFRALKA